MCTLPYDMNYGTFERPTCDAPLNYSPFGCYASLITNPDDCAAVNGSWLMPRVCCVLHCSHTCACMWRVNEWGRVSVSVREYEWVRWGSMSEWVSECILLVCYVCFIYWFSNALTHTHYTQQETQQACEADLGCWGIYVNVLDNIPRYYQWWSAQPEVDCADCGNQYLPFWQWSTVCKIIKQWKREGKGREILINFFHPGYMDKWYNEKFECNPKDIWS